MIDKQADPHSRTYVRSVIDESLAHAFRARTIIRARKARTCLPIRGFETYGRKMRDRERERKGKGKEDTPVNGSAMRLNWEIAFTRLALFPFGVAFLLERLARPADENFPL